MNRFDCLWSDVKREPWLSSIILCEYRRLDRSEADKNNHVLFPHAFRPFLWNLLSRIFNFYKSKKLAVTKKCVLRYFRSETDNLRFIIRSKQEIVRQNVSLEWKIVEFDMCRRRKIWIVASKFLYAFTIILQSWMITIIVEISVIFWKLGFWGCSNLALLQDQTLQVHNQTSSIDKALYVRVGHRNSLNWSVY